MSAKAFQLTAKQPSTQIVLFKPVLFLFLCTNWVISTRGERDDVPGGPYKRKALQTFLSDCPALCSQSGWEPRSDAPSPGLGRHVARFQSLQGPQPTNPHSHVLLRTLECSHTYFLTSQMNTPLLK